MLSVNNPFRVRVVMAALGLLWLSAVPEILAQEAGFSVQNAPEELERNIRVLVNLPNLSCETPAAALGRFLPGIRDRITRAGRALGYYYLTQQTRFVDGDDCWRLETLIEPGEPVTIGNIQVTLASDETLFEDTLANLPIRSGDQLDHGLYEQSKSDLSARAVELGFFAARYSSSELRLDLQRNIADVDIAFDPGERYRFGEVQIEPVDALSEDFIRRYINFDSDNYYSAEALIDLRNSLNDSFYFSSVTVSPALDQVTQQQVPIQVGLRLRPRRVYSTGIGVTTDIGPRLRLDYEDRYLNQRGHRFEVKSGASPIQQLIDLNYSIPWTNPATERLTFSGGVLHEDNDTFTLQTTKFGVNYSFINRSNWRLNYFVNFQHDTSEINHVQEISDLLIPGISITRTRADDALYPRRGWMLFGQVSGTSDALLSTESFLQFDLRGKGIYPLGPGRVLVRFEAGMTVTDDVENLPASIQYFTGGDQSVRGYRYQSLGPVDDDGELVGGKHVLVGGIEYDFNILPDWKMALFADAGNAFLDFADYELKKSVGLGVRWLSPLGPIRLDLARALDDDNRFRIHLTMGPDL